MSGENNNGIVSSKGKYLKKIDVGGHSTHKNLQVEDWFCGFPSPTLIEGEPVHLEDTSNCNYLGILHSVIAQLALDDPNILAHKNLVNTTLEICPSTLAKYLHWLIVSVLRDRGLLVGPVVYEPGFSSASEDLLIPTPLAKMLEYMMPYEDNYTGNKYSSVYYAPAFDYDANNFFGLYRGSSCWVTNPVDKYQEVNVMNLYSTTKEYSSHITTFTSLVQNVELYSENRQLFNEYLSMVSWTVPLRSIPRKAPDASFFAHPVTSGWAYCGTPNFSGEMAFVFRYFELGTSIGYFQPYCQPGPTIRNMYCGNFNETGANFTIQRSVYKSFVHLLSRSPYVAGSVWKMLKKCLYGKVKILSPVLYYNDTSAMKNAIAAILSTLPSGTVIDRDIVLLDICVYSAMIAKVAPYNYFGDTKTDYMNLLFYDKSYLDIKFHPIISQIISRLGPVVLPNGAVVFPQFYMDVHEYALWMGSLRFMLTADGPSHYPFGPAVYTSAGAGIFPTAYLDWPDDAMTLEYGVTPYLLTEQIVKLYVGSTIYQALNTICIPISKGLLGDLTSYCYAHGSKESPVFYGKMIVYPSAEYKYEVFSLEQVHNMLVTTDLSMLKHGAYYYGSSNYPFGSALSGKQYSLQKIIVSQSRSPIFALAEFVQSKEYGDSFSIASGSLIAKGKIPNYLGISNMLNLFCCEGIALPTMKYVRSKDYWKLVRGWVDVQYDQELHILGSEERVLEGDTADVIKEQLADKNNSRRYTSICPLLKKLAITDPEFVKEMV